MPDDKTEDKRYILGVILIVIVIVGVYAFWRHNRQKKLAQLLFFCIAHNKIQNNNMNEIEAILKTYPDFANAKCETYERSGPLCFAYSKEMTELLISYGANINARNAVGRTPLHCMVNNWAIEPMKVLISKGADVKARDNKGWTPLHCLVDARIFDQRGIDIWKILVSKGIDINARDNDGRTPLTIALQNKNMDFADFLRQQGAKE